jgi:glutamate-1-semialdehyde aminotransferase
VDLAGRLRRRAVSEGSEDTCLSVRVRRGVVQRTEIKIRSRKYHYTENVIRYFKANTTKFKSGFLFIEVNDYKIKNNENSVEFNHIFFDVYSFL